jgi:hypothetical protein
MSDWFFHLPVPWMALITFAVTYLATAGIYVVVTRLAVGERGRAFKGISAGMLPPLGIVFGLFVAFIAAQVWSDIDRANTAVNREASALSTVVYLSESFPGEPERQLRDLVRNHIQDAATKEWPLMAQRAASLTITPQALAKALQFTLALTPRSEGQITAQREIVAALGNALDARRQRIIVSHSSVNAVKWSCLILQAICTLLTIAKVHSDNRVSAAIAMWIFSTGVAVSVLLIAAHDQPFSGPISIGPGPLLQVLPEEAATQKEFDHTIALHLAGLLRSSRAVISDNQDLINQSGTNKDLTGARVLELAKADYARSTGHPLPVLDKTSMEGMLLQAESDAILEVMDAAQPLINHPNRDFKGFLPATFAYRVAQVFSQKVGDLAYLKLTAPQELIRQKSNMPDAWENRTITNVFQSPGWKKEGFVAEVAELNGKKAYRLLIPEYYDVSCLACHGEPKGATDISGWKKEGGKLGDLGGALSAGIYLK